MAIATTVHNNCKNATTGLSPNDILFGYEPNLAPQDSPPTNNEAVQQCIELLKEKRTQAINAINKMAGSSQTIPSQFQVGNQVWLEATHLKLHHQKTKLAPKCYGPFQVVEEVSLVAYQIKLPTSWGIHNMFHASLLSPYHEMTAHGPNFSWPPPDLIDGEEEYEVERVVNHWHHGKARRLQYLIKWKGYPESDNTWEPSNQVHAPELIREYHKCFPLEDKRARARLIAAILQTGCPSPQNPHSNPSLHTSSHPPQPGALSSPTSSSNLPSPFVIGITFSVTDFPKAMPGNMYHIATTAGVHSIILTDHKRCLTTTATASHTIFAAPPPQKNGQPTPTTSPLNHDTMTLNPRASGQETPLLKNGLLTLLMPKRKKLPSYQYPTCGETPLTNPRLASGAHEHLQGETIGKPISRPMT
jgi:Chromo (CHRromatin Organisation MOdifier) domain